MKVAQFKDLRATDKLLLGLLVTAEQGLLDTDPLPPQTNRGLSKNFA